jgi:hypothetical protein
MEGVTWHTASDNPDGIETIALQDLDTKTHTGRIVGYNGILKGDQVIYQMKEYTVVMVSRLGHFGLSDTGTLPYTVTAFPKEVTRKPRG